MRVNEQPLSAFGLEPTGSDGRVSFASGSLVITEIPETSGGQLLRKELDRPRRVTIRCKIRGSTEKEFYENRDKVADLLDGALEVRFTDVDALADRILYCQMEEFTPTGGVDPEWTTPVRDFSLVLVAQDPFFYDRLGSIVGEGDVPLGTGPCKDFTTEIGGPSSNPLRFVLKDFRGNVINRLEWDAALVAGEWLEIRHQRALIRKFTAVGTYVDAYANLDQAASLFGFFSLAPDLASRQHSAWPRIELEAGAPTSFIHKYRRGWH